MKQYRAVIVGGGFAGAATAYHLARRGFSPVLIVERETVPGSHSSGRNAAMVRQVVPDPWIAELARAGARAIRSLRTARRPVEFHANGSLLVAGGDRLQALEREAALARDAGLSTERLTRAEAAGRVSILEDADFEEGCFCPSDGVVDIAGLLDHYLQGARDGGTQLLLGQEVSEIVVEGGKVAGVRVGEETVRAPVVVNAAGAWASELAARAGALSIAFRSLRRHLMFTGPMSIASKRWPFVWDLEHEVYFRPESGGLLLSPCDAGTATAGLPEVDPAAIQLLHDKLSRHLPRLGDLPIARAWAGLRVFAPDDRFIIGPDPLLPGFFWAAALAGHGVTTSDAVGSLAADLVERPERDQLNPFSPGRFQKAAK